MSGEGYLLCGDAAALIEPATGEGIGNAMLSGKLAAEHLKRAFVEGDLSSGNLKSYDEEVYRKLWKDLQNKYRAQRILGERRWLMNWLVARANARGPVRWLMRKVF
jgi:flavin-dependent dehydrogenase